MPSRFASHLPCAAVFALTELGRAKGKEPLSANFTTLGLTYQDMPVLRAAADAEEDGVSGAGRGELCDRQGGGGF